jgi:hypothetical protein
MDRRKTGPTCTRRPAPSAECSNVWACMCLQSPYVVMVCAYLIFNFTLEMPVLYFAPFVFLCIFVLTLYPVYLAFYAFRI